MKITDTPLKGLKVLDFSQFLAGPYATLRFADLGADVIKVERKGKGDLSRHLYVSNVVLDGESTVFHAINRGKRSLAVDLKSESDRAKIWSLVAEADVVVQNFRPGVIERLGFGPDVVLDRNPRIIYGSISGYGQGHEWQELPGQDLLAQARTGAMWLSGAHGSGPVPIGLPVADILAGAALAQGILALLVRRGITGKGGHVETSLLEAMTDLQFELISTHLNDGGRAPERPKNNPAHAYLAAPYGVYETKDGYLAIAMNDLDGLFQCLGIETPLAPFDPFEDRDAIARMISDRLATESCQHWINLLEASDLWAATVLEWSDLLGSGILQKLGMLAATQRGGVEIGAVLSPLRVDGHRPSALSAAPYLCDAALAWKE